MELHLLLTAWNFDPILIVALLVLLGGYFAAIGPLRARFAWAEPVPSGRIVAFVCGWALLALSVLSPLDTIGREYSFTFHTVELFVIITAVAPLLMIGMPDWLVAKLLLTKSIREASRGFLFSVVAVLGFNGLILIWHAGPLYELALHSPLWHDVQLLCFLLAGILTWWPLLTPAYRHTRMASPAQILYLVAESLPLDIFGVAALFAPSVFYHTYDVAPRIFGLNPMLDQQIAGGILAVPGNLLDIVLMSVIFFAWIAKIEQAQRRKEAVLYEQEDRAAQEQAAATLPSGEAGAAQG